MRGKKGDTTDTIMVVVLMLLVIAVVAIFLFKGQITEKLRNLPNFQVPPDKYVDMSKLDQTTKSKYCNIIVAKIVDGNLAFCGDSTCTQTINSNLIIKGDEHSAFVYYHTPWYLNNVLVGSVTEDKLTLNPTGFIYLLFIRYNDILGQGRATLQQSNLAVYNLQGSTFFSGYFCRPDVVTLQSGEKILNKKKIASVDYLVKSEYQSTAELYISLAYGTNFVATPFYIQFVPFREDTGFSGTISGTDVADIAIYNGRTSNELVSTIGYMTYEGNIVITEGEYAYNTMKNGKQGLTLPTYQDIQKLNKATYFAGGFYA